MKSSSIFYIHIGANVLLIHASTLALQTSMIIINPAFNSSDPITLSYYAWHIVSDPTTNYYI